jgi:transcriptional regulator with XRE-family HTH domain
MDEIMRRKRIPSDYALAKALGVSKQTISRYRSGYGHFDDAIALRVADLMGIDPGIVLIDVHLERTKNAEVRSVWEKVSAGFPALLSQANSAREALPCW